MSLQWMKRKAKGFEGRKENSKVNDRLQKLIFDLKSKRESLASVQTGFPSSVASFVTNTWMPSGEKKKQRWPYMKKKGFSKAECPVRGSCGLETEICVDPQSGGQFSDDPQSGGEILEQICVDPQSGMLFSAHPQSQGEILEQTCSGLTSSGQFDNDLPFVGQFGNDLQSRGQFGNDLQSGGRYGNDTQSGGRFGNVPGEFGNDPQFSKRFGNDQQSRGHFGNDPQSKHQFGNISGQLGNGLVSVGQFYNDPQSIEVVHEQNYNDNIVEEISSVGQLGICSPVSEGPARLCPLCKELLVVVLILVVSLSMVLDVKKAAVGVTAIVYLLVRMLFRKQEAESATECVSARNCFVSNLRSICRQIKGTLASLLEWKNEVKSEAFPVNGTISVPCSNSTKEVCKGIQCSKLSKSDVNRKPRKRRAHMQKSCLSRGISEECRLEKMDVRVLKFSSALGSSVLIVVLLGLISGRFPAFVLALGWCLLVKLVQIAEGGRNIGTSIKGKKQISFTHTN